MPFDANISNKLGRHTRRTDCSQYLGLFASGPKKWRVVVHFRSREENADCVCCGHFLFRIFSDYSTADDLLLSPTQLLSKEYNTCTYYIINNDTWLHQPKVCLSLEFGRQMFSGSAQVRGPPSPSLMHQFGMLLATWAIWVTVEGHYLGHGRKRARVQGWPTKITH